MDEGRGGEGTDGTGRDRKGGGGGEGRWKGGGERNQTLSSCPISLNTGQVLGGSKG